MEYEWTIHFKLCRYQKCLSYSVCHTISFIFTWCLTNPGFSLYLLSCSLCLRYVSYSHCLRVTSVFNLSNKWDKTYKIWLITEECIVHHHGETDWTWWLASNRKNIMACFKENMTAGLRQSKYDTWFETTQKSWIVWDKVHMTYGLRQREYDA